MRSGDDLRQALLRLQPPESWYEKSVGSAPWGVTIHDREWIGATDGHVLILIAADAPVVSRLTGKYLAQLPTWMEADSYPVSLADLSEFANVGAEMRPCAKCKDEREFECDECDGAGYRDCECTDCGDVHESRCDQCRGTGQVKCSECSDFRERRSGLLCGRVVNRQLIRLVIDTLRPDGSMVRLGTNEVNGGMYVLTEDAEQPAWMAVVMQMRADMLPKPKVEFEKPETWRTVAA